MMTLFQKIVKLYPELKDKDFDLPPIGTGTIELRNDGSGDYINVWRHPTLPEPTDDQLQEA